MSILSIVIFAVFLLIAVAALSISEPELPVGGMTGLERGLWRVFGFFGIGEVPPGLTLAVCMSTAAIAGAALDIIATMHLAAAYPAWFPANAAASGLGIGLLCARLLSASNMPRPEREPAHLVEPQQHAHLTPRARVWPASASVPVSLNTGKSNTGKSRE